MGVYWVHEGDRGEQIKKISSNQSSLIFDSKLVSVTFKGRNGMVGHFNKFRALEAILDTNKNVSMKEITYVGTANGLQQYLHELLIEFLKSEDYVDTADQTLWKSSKKVEK